MGKAKKNKKKFYSENFSIRRVKLENVYKAYNDPRPETTQRRRRPKQKTRRNTQRQRDVTPEIRNHGEIIIGKKCVKFIIQMDDEKKENLKLREFIPTREREVDKLIETPSARDFHDVAQKAYDLISIYTAVLHDRAAETMVESCSSKKGREKLVDELNATTEEDRIIFEAEIETLINASLAAHYLKVEKNRKMFQINDSLWGYFNPRQEAKIKDLPPSIHSNYVSSNKLHLGAFSPDFIDKTQQLEEHEKTNAKCDCTGGKCGRNCQCTTIQRVIGSNRLTYACSKLCGCEGKCDSTFQEPADNTIEIVMHPNVKKGLCARSTTYLAQGETVVELTGIINLQPVPREGEEEKPNYYCFNHFAEGDRQAIKKLLSKNYFTGRNFLNAEYVKSLEEVMSLELMVDPEDFGNKGRYISSSCLGNMKATMLLQNGLDPTKMRVMLTTTTPIYPGMEPTYAYSPGYICTYLRESCLCGHLCCVTNRRLYPYITKDHLSRFYKRYYKFFHSKFNEKLGKKPSDS